MHENWLNIYLSLRQIYIYIYMNGGSKRTGLNYISFYKKMLHEKGWTKIQDGEYHYLNGFWLLKERHSYGVNFSSFA